MQTAFAKGVVEPGLLTSLAFVLPLLQATSTAEAIKVVAIEMMILFILFFPNTLLNSFQKNGGSGEIRTHEQITPSPVFKTGAFNRSATLPSFVF